MVVRISNRVHVTVNKYYAVGALTFFLITIKQFSISQRDEYETKCTASSNHVEIMTRIKPMDLRGYIVFLTFFPLFLLFFSEAYLILHPL